jgi:hypothetical protein
MTKADLKLERQAIAVAYGAHVQALFKTLIANLALARSEPAAVDKCVEQFYAGLNLGRYARELVGNVEDEEGLA